MLSCFQELTASLPGKLLKPKGIPAAETLGRSVEENMDSYKQEGCFGIVDLGLVRILIQPDQIEVQLKS